MSLLVDTSVWSLAFRRDHPTATPEVNALLEAIDGADVIVTTGFVIQELLQGFSGAKARESILQRFEALPLVMPDKHDHIAAADIRNACRQNGVQIGTVDALLIQLCVHYDLSLLTTDQDFRHANRHVSFGLWTSGN